MPNRLHRRDEFAAKRAAWRAACRLAAAARASTGCWPTAPSSCSARRSASGCPRSSNPAARDLVRHAFADVGGNGNRARSWAKFARRWPVEAQRQLLDAYPRDGRCRCCCCGPTRTPAHPVDAAREALDLLPDGQLRTLPGTGFLIAYDDPVGVARELIAFCG